MDDIVNSSSRAHRARRAGPKAAKRSAASLRRRGLDPAAAAADSAQARKHRDFSGRSAKATARRSAELEQRRLRAPQPAAVAAAGERSSQQGGLVV